MTVDRDRTYWIACSGGLDSVVLAHVMAGTQKHIGLLHCNFQLRGKAAAKDEDFVVNLGRQLGAPVKVKRWNTKEIAEVSRENTQLTARNLRYSWFNTFVEIGDRVCLGHHRDDQLETFFLQLRRGAKVQGLSCMPKYKDGFVRPLLTYKKSELHAIAKKNNWSWREDQSNASNIYQRNLYRNLVIPSLKKQGLNEQSVIACIENFQLVLNDLQENYTPEEQSEVVKVEHAAWNVWPYWFKHYFLTFHNWSKFPVHEVDKLIKSSKGACFQSEKFSIWNEGDYLAIVSSQQESKALSTSLVPPEEVNYQKNALYIDADKVKGQLWTRKWENGDVFQPLGAPGRKKVSKFLSDKHVPHYLRPYAQVLLDDQRVIGLFGYLPDDAYRVKNSTKLIRQCNLQ